MYYDLILPYKIKEGCAMGIQEDGEQLPIYTKITLGKAKAPISEHGYDEIHDRMRQQIADLVHEEVEMVVCISGEEYEANTDSDDDDGDREPEDESE